MLFNAVAKTEIGLVREENEDAFLCDSELKLFAVADGIGGLPGGAEAAIGAINTLVHYARKEVAQGLPIDLANACLKANSQIIAMSRVLAPDTGMGTTLCALALHGDHATFVNIGDSRAYLFRANTLHQLTTDDTVENELKAQRARGEPPPASPLPLAALTRCIGQPMPLEIEPVTKALLVDDLLFLCTDGISGFIPANALAAHLAQPLPLQAILDGLLTESLARGGHDNATAVLIRILPPNLPP